jgi:hypothetical protein
MADYMNYGAATNEWHISAPPSPLLASGITSIAYAGKKLR